MLIHAKFDQYFSRDIRIQLLFSFILFLWSLFALYSGLSGGIFVTLIFILLSGLAIKYGEPLVLIAAVFSLLVGHSKLFSSDSVFLADFTYIVFNFYLIFYLFRLKKIDKLFILLHTSLIFTSIFSEFDLLAYYKSASGLNAIFIISHLISRHGALKPFYSRVFLLIAFSLLFICFIQVLGFKVTLSSGSIWAGSINVLGFDLVRPIGLSGFAHNTGNALLFGLFLVWKYYPGSGFDKILSYKYSLLIFTILFLLFASLSQRVYVLVPLVAFSLHVFVKANKLFGFLFLVAVIACGYVLFFSLLSMLDASNALKVAMWMEVLSSLSNGSIIDILFGNGLGSSMEVTKDGDFSWIVDLLQIGKWDININGEYPIHNIYLELLYEQGAFIFCVVLYCIVSLFLQARRAQVVSIELVLFACFLINYFVHNGLYGYLFMFYWLAKYRYDCIEKTKPCLSRSSLVGY